MSALLLVLPGMSSPFHPDYAPVYDLLRNRGKDRGVDVRVLQYPGQTDAYGEVTGEVSPKTSVRQVLNVIEEYEAQQRPYYSLGISYGAFVSLAAAVSAKASICWRRAIIWGPIPHWMAWRDFGQEERNPRLGKGTVFGSSHKEFYNECQPNEILIQKAPMPVAVGVGSLDNYVGEGDLMYLKWLCKNVRHERQFRFLQGCRHNVKQDDPGANDYLTMVFDGISDSQQSDGCSRQ